MMVANLPLLMICLQIASTISSAGAGSPKINITGGINRLAPNCETTVKKLCDENDISKQGAITRIDVNLRECHLDCHSKGGTHISSMNLPVLPIVPYLFVLSFGLATCLKWKLLL
uniref:Putative salp15 n=1 Tax=Ixodes ricinus TaxID=34613 RepID=A0A0K8RIS3_IXORI